MSSKSPIDVLVAAEGVFLNRDSIVFITDVPEVDFS
jgi:hypothetical protein